MKIGSIPSLACVGLGAVLGFLAATKDFSGATRGDDALPPSAKAAVPSQPGLSSGNPSPTCTDGLGQAQLLARALFSSRPWSRRKRPRRARSPTSSSSGAMTSASTTSAPITTASWATGRPTSIAWAKKGRCSPTSTPSRAARPGVPRSFWGSIRSAPACLTIGMPGSPHGIPDWTPTIADLLKQQGYATGQFGKNHLGDNNKHLPTVHGFDEFFGNLYHLNAEEEPEGYYYPKDPEFKKKYGPRGVLHCTATDVDDPTVDPKWGRVGKQKIEDTGPLTSSRMPTIDQEIYGHAVGFHRSLGQGRTSRSSSGSTRPACTSGPT